MEMIMKLTAENYDKKITIELPDDSDLYQVFDSFYALVIGLSFPQKAWADVVSEMAEDYTPSRGNTDGDV
jgi:hypothetical protein